MSDDKPASPGPTFHGRNNVVYGGHWPMAKLREDEAVLTRQHPGASTPSGAAGGIVVMLDSKPIPGAVYDFERATPGYGHKRRQ